MSEIVLSLDPGVDFAIAVFQGGGLVDAVFQEIPPDEADVLVVEFPKWYPTSKGTPNTIVRLAWNAGMIAGQIAARAIAEVPTVAVPKSIVRTRVRAMLDDGELANLDAALKDVPAGKQHNVYDAVRHGLVYLGRLRA